MHKADPATKEKILSTALDMFSKRGYTSVSIRDIGGAIGIKESSIYYHFVNKKAIFDELLARADFLTVTMKDAFNSEVSLVTKVGEKAFIQAGIAYVEKFLLEDRIYKLINVLAMEKQMNEAAADCYHRLLFDVPAEHHEQVFALLEKKGILSGESHSILASEYQSIILFIYFKYFSTYVSITQERKLLAKTELAGLLKRFYQRYFRKGN